MPRSLQQFAVLKPSRQGDPPKDPNKPKAFNEALTTTRSKSRQGNPEEETCVKMVAGRGLFIFAAVVASRKRLIQHGLINGFWHVVERRLLRAAVFACVTGMGARWGDSDAVS